MPISSLPPGTITVAPGGVGLLHKPHDVRQPGETPRYPFKGDETYVRASIIDSDGRRGWTQPVFFDSRATRQP